MPQDFASLPTALHHTRLQAAYYGVYPKFGKNTKVPVKVAGLKIWPKNLYHLNRIESINLVDNLCPEFTARIVDRWIDLEQKERGISPYGQLQNLLQMKVSEQIGKIGSGLMNKRKEDKKLLKAVEKQLAAHCQLTIDFDVLV